MAVGTLSVSSSKDQGLRPVDLRRDLRAIARLMEICFSDTLDQNGRGAVREMEQLSHSGPLLWLIGAMAPQWQMGFVWLENGYVVGNVSTQMSEYDRGTWLIANVAVHPDFRRRGIATALTKAALDLSSRSRAHRTLLQVHQHNATAFNLYHALGFNPVTTRSTWERASVLEPPQPAAADYDLRPARRDEWEGDFNLAAQYRPAGFNWLRPLRQDDWRPSYWRSFQQFISGIRHEHWLAVSKPDGQLAGACYLLTGQGSHDEIDLLVSPGHQGRLERPLLALGLRRLGRRPWSLRIDHPTPDPSAEEVFMEFGFRRLQTLIWMERFFQ
jgi:GNAT superfamily N-acetyltransferase